MNLKDGKFVMKTQQFLEICHSKLVVITTLILLLTGCSTSQKELLPIQDGQTMRAVWDDKTIGSVSQSVNSLNQSRGLDTKPLTDNVHYSRSVTNEIDSQFVRLPNPDLVMYVYPHLVGNSSGEQLPIPGYSTVFPLYSQPKYALPGEVPTPQQHGGE